MPPRKRKQGVRRGKSVPVQPQFEQQQREEEPIEEIPRRQPAPEPEPEPEPECPRSPVKKFWRDGDEPLHPIVKKRHDKSRNLFTLKVHMKGSFKKFKGKRVWVGDSFCYLDWQHKEEVTLISLSLNLGAMGVTGLSEYWYRRPTDSLSDGLVWLKTNDDVVDMTMWVPAFKEIELYILHPSKEDVLQRLFGEMYVEIRRMWPKAVIEELNEEEARRENQQLLLEWYPEEVGGVVEVLSEAVVDDHVVDDHVVFNEEDHVVFNEEEREILINCGLAGDGDRTVEMEVNDVVMEDVRGDEVEADVVVDEVETDVVVDEVETDVVVDEVVIEERTIGDEADVVVDETVSDEVYDEVDDDEWINGVDDDDEVADLFPWSVAEERPDPDFVDFDTQEAPQDFNEFMANRAADEDEVHEQATHCYRSQEEADELLGPLVVEDMDMHDIEVPGPGGDEDGFPDGEADVDLEGDSDNRLDDDPKIHFNKHVHLRRPVLVPGMVFASVADARLFVRSVAISTRKPLQFKRNEKHRLQVVCKNRSCKFYIWCSRIGRTDELALKKINKEHTCGNVTRNTNLRVSQLALMYVDRIRRYPNISLLSFIGDVAAELGLHISTATAFRTIRAAGELLYGNEREQFRQLRRYGQALLDAMPDSTVRIRTDRTRFEGIYVCLAPLKKGFKDGCRRFICLDGCFLKGSFRGQILAAVGVDADNGIYPVAWGVVGVENTDNWTWFVHLLRQDLEMDTCADSWVLMSDQHRGLETAIKDELPLAEHRFCVRHIHSNWSARFGGQVFKDMLWEAARAANDAYYEQAMNKLRQMSAESVVPLDKIGKNSWSRSGFKRGSNCDMLVNNWAEAFNICIMKARNQPILTMLNTIHQIVMARIVKEQKEKEKWPGAVCPRVEKLIKQRQSLTSNYITSFCGNMIYEVKTAEHAFIVDAQKQVCSCGMWDLSGIPCVHAVCVCTMEDKNPRHLVHPCFSREVFLKIYSHCLAPIGAPVFWPNVDCDAIIPPRLRVMPGRPKKKRRVHPSEIKDKAEKAKKKKSAKQDGTEVHTQSRKGQANHCKICKQQGHNVRSCSLRFVGSMPSSQESNLHSRDSMSQPPAGTSTSATVGQGTPREQGTSSQPLRRSSRARM